jgi:hypothetical protein
MSAALPESSPILSYKSTAHASPPALWDPVTGRLDPLREQAEDGNRVVGGEGAITRPLCSQAPTTDAAPAGMVLVVTSPSGGADA